MFKLLKKIFPPLPPKDKVASVVPISKPVDLQVISADALQKRGNDLLRDGKFEHAVDCYRQAVAAAPTKIEGFINLSYALKELKLSVEAEQMLRRALEIDPANVDAMYMLATLSRDLDRCDDAIGHFEKILELKPDFELVYAEFCDLLDQNGRHDQAKAVITKGIALFPNMARYHYILGKIYAKADSHEQAVASFYTSISLQPKYANLHFHLSGSLYAQGKLNEAIDHLRQAIAMKSDYADAYGSLGTILADRNLLDESLDSFRHAIRLEPDRAEWNFNESLCRLRMGDYENGWRQYEWRWKDGRFKNRIRNFIQPLWLGNAPIMGKAILLYSEQGLGDTIQFCRYTKLLAERGATVFLQVPKALCSLLSSLEGVSLLLETDQPLPQFEFHCPLLSLPLAFKTDPSTVPCEVPYLSASLELTRRVSNELADDKSFKIGICWKGNSNYPKDAERSPGVAPFVKLLSRYAKSPATFYTLLPDSRQIFSTMGGKDLGYELDQNTAPFAETAALMMNLDLIITCDTSIGHIAAALGKPVWIVLAFSPDWRWIRNREDSPWYPRTRLFFQKTSGDWDELFERVRSRLDKVLSGLSEPVWPVKNPDQKNLINDQKS